MSFSAYVHCNCWKEGKTKPYPFDFGFHLNEWDDWVIDVPRPDANADEATRDAYYEKWNKFRTWMDDACEHPDMILIESPINARSANFYWALHQIGWEHFPTLKAEWPIYNDGIIQPAVVARMIDELNFFKQQGKFAVGARLWDPNDTVWEAFDRYREGVFDHYGETMIDIGVDIDGLFIMRRHRDDDVEQDKKKLFYHIHEPREELFRAMRIQIRDLTEGVEFTNLDNGNRFVIPSNEYLFWQNWASDEQLHVVVDYETPDDYFWPVEDLLEVCKASVESGNPFHWS